MRFLIFSAVLMFSASVQASCYSKSEFEAEQGLRIHSELMVISLNCQHVSHRNGNLYIQYKDFTRRNQGLISGYEQTLKSYYSRNGSGSGETAINSLRTKLANKISNDAARMRPNVFCKAYSNRIAQALGMSQEKLRRWAATPFSGHPVSRPMCRS